MRMNHLVVAALVTTALIVASCGEDSPTTPLGPSPVAPTAPSTGTQMAPAGVETGFAEGPQSNEMNYGVTDGLESGDMSYDITNGLESGGIEYAVTDGVETAVMTDAVTDGTDSDGMNYAVANGLESGDMSYMAESTLGLTDNRVANAKAPKTLDLSRIEWKWNEHKNKLVPKDATDNEGNGSASARSADSRVHLIHVWVRGNGTGLAVVDSYETDLAGKVLNLGGGIRPELAHRGRTNPIRYVANLSTGNVDYLKERMDSGGGSRTRAADDCVLTLVGETTVLVLPNGGNDNERTVSIEFTTNGFCAIDARSYIRDHFHTDASWITGVDLVRCDETGSGLACPTGGGFPFLGKVRGSVHNGTTRRSGKVWFTANSGGAGAAGRTADRTVKQNQVEHAPTIESFTCEQRDRSSGTSKSCSGGINPNGQSPKLTAVGADPNTDDTLTYTWEKTGGSWHSTSSTDGTAYWIAPRSREETSNTITVTVSDSVAATADASRSITVDVPSCIIHVDGNSHVEPATGLSGYDATGGVGRLNFRKGDHDACPIPGMANFATRPEVDWITATGTGTLSRAEDPTYTHYIEYTVKPNDTYEPRTTSLGTNYLDWIWPRFIPVGQAGLRRTPGASTCPTTAITYQLTSWKVGDRYRGSGFTQPWPKMGYGPPGGCRSNGLPLSQPGRVRICGYGVADNQALEACKAASRPARATDSTDPTVGPVTYVTSSGSYTTTATGNTAAAQWVEFLVSEGATSGLSLAVGTNGDTDFGWKVYLHFGREHASDLSYGDSDYGTWGMGDPAWTFTEDATGTFTAPTLTESSRYEGVFNVACATTNGKPTGGFSVAATVSRSSQSYTASADHTAPAPAYTTICKP